MEKQVDFEKDFVNLRLCTCTLNYELQVQMNNLTFVLQLQIYVFETF